MEVLKPKILQRNINLSKPDQTITLNRLNLSMSNILLEPTEFNFGTNFFVQGYKDSLQGPHKLISCQSNNIRVYSISADQGIQLKSEFIIPDLAKKGKIGSIRDIFYYQKMNKLRIKTNEMVESNTNIHYLEINLNKDPSKALSRLRSIPITIDPFNIAETSVIKGSHSARIYAKNSVFYVNGLSVTQSFLTPERGFGWGPKILYKTENNNLNKIFRGVLTTISEQDLARYKQIMRFDDWNLNFSRAFQESFYHEVNIENINNRQYSIEFSLFGFLKIIKVYDKQSRKILKVVNFVPAKILDEGFKANDLDSQKVEKIYFDFDLSEDRITFYGWMNNAESEGISKRKFKLTAMNCLLKKKDQSYQVESID